MASETPHGGGRTERCERCCEETPHAVTVELRVESEPDGDPPFARRPYRVSSCRECGTESVHAIEEP
ncbi:small CPxCG-related zinc finger protein [Halobacterium hubeiense]|jgi:hypothetical protein|uniref:Small CPxCG-related zinc finger protein n=2 Tax=Halobacterium TaxID=2239 RepID=A0A0U5H2C2_9EURY|nr:hypothetical protein [Halobacterium hubeiense]CQH60083.1 small CPxCG-related zinc finger protein [Halobacterium hubeiense]